MTEIRLGATRANGTPYVKPEPADFPDTGAYLRAFHAYRDEICDDGNRSFDASFRNYLAGIKRSDR